MTKSLLLISDKRPFNKRTSLSKTQCNHRCDESCHEPKKPAARTDDDDKKKKKKPIFEMIVEAIKHLNDGESGSTMQKIKSYLGNCEVGTEYNKAVNAVLLENVKNNNLRLISGAGASRKYALPKDNTKKAASHETEEEEDEDDDEEMEEKEEEGDKPGKN